jgi:hypothetical protein
MMPIAPAKPNPTPIATLQMKALPPMQIPRIEKAPRTLWRANIRTASRIPVARSIGLVPLHYAPSLAIAPDLTSESCCRKWVIRVPLTIRLPRIGPRSVTACLRRSIAGRKLSTMLPGKWECV